MNNLKIGFRLGGGFGLILSLLTLIVVIGVVQLSHISGIAGQLVETDWVKAEKMGLIGRLARDNNSLTLEMFIAPDDQQLDRIRQQIAGNKKTIGAALEALDGMVTRPEARVLLAKLKESRAAYVASVLNVDQLIVTGKRDQAVQLMLTETAPKLTSFMENVNQLEKMLKDLVGTHGSDVKQTVDLTTNLMIFLGAAAIAIGCFLSYVVSRSITRPIIEAVKIAETVAAGDLSSTIEVRSKDETGQLLTALKQMNQNLVDIVTRVRAGTDTIATASGQIAAGNHDLSARTEEQAGAIEETASSMEELTASTRQNADNARQAIQLARSASDVAKKGGEVVSHVVVTMDAIHQSAAKIVEIIGVVDSIAFQTNILALNAAVEAAHAGEHGRGFSVVASEVRNLAQRSAAAAREINVLIDSSVERIGAGSRLATEAGTTMDEVVISVARMSDIIAEITSASIEQSAGIEQINQAIVQMDQVTQQNAALVEEAAAAAESMEDQSKTLVDAVSVFRIAETQTAATKSTSGLKKINAGLAAGQSLQHTNRGPFGRLANSLTGNAGAENWEQF